MKRATLDLPTPLELARWGFRFHVLRSFELLAEGELARAVEYWALAVYRLRQLEGMEVAL